MSSPVSGYLNCYALNSDGKVYCKNSSGTAKAFTYSGDIVNADLTGSAGITNANLANMANGTFKCRTSGGTGAPEDCTGTQATALLNAAVGDSGSGGTKGLVPAPSAGDAAAGKFLKADATWAVPSGFTNPMTTLGDIMYENATPTAARLAGNTTSTKKFLTQTGTGAVSAVPAWGSIVSGDLPADVVYNDVNANISAKYVFNASPAASSPTMKFTGGVYVAGSASTNVPSVYIADGSDLSWSANGTYFGVNGTPSFTGNLLDLQLDGTSKFKVDYQGIATGNGSGLTNLNASNASSGVEGYSRFISSC
jgi:hypothetical protein